MNLKLLKDEELLSRTKLLVQKEREVLVEVLHHLREVERRKLFSDLGYKSLFEYAVNELKYSEGQAGRRIQAMRLIKEIPQVAEKVQSGALSLSNLSQAQSYFREVKKSLDNQRVNQDGALRDLKTEKWEILKSLENKSAREGQKVLLQRHGEKPLPKESARLVSATHTEMKFLISEDLQEKIEELKSLLGPKAFFMSFSELVEWMTAVSIEQLKIKKFGKKRALAEKSGPLAKKLGALASKGIFFDGVSSEGVSSEGVSSDGVSSGGVSSGGVSFDGASSEGVLSERISFEGTSFEGLSSDGISPDGTSTSGISLKEISFDEVSSGGVSSEGISFKAAPAFPFSTPTSELGTGKKAITERSFKKKKRVMTENPLQRWAEKRDPSQSGLKVQNPRYIPKALRHKIWTRDRGRCTQCGGRTNLQIDHIQPVALGGETSAENLRLLCFHCNQRQALRVFGSDVMGRFF